jgi:hypothetical protein
MRWKRNRDEWVPWYRVPGFKGKVSEADKSRLDAFRTEERHPAASYQDLPDEVQSYISRLEVENYDYKQGRAANGPLVGTVLGGVILAINYFGVHISPSESIWPYAFGLFILIAPWIVYRKEWQRNADELFPTQQGEPSQSDENIRKEWELDFLARNRTKDTA